MPLAQSLLHHWPMYVGEAAGLGTFMVSACLTVALLEHPASRVRRAISSMALRQAIVGVAMGLTAIAIIYSPLGRLSGAHLNPATTITFTALGKVAPWDAVLYIGAQFTGGAAGLGLAVFALRGAAAHPAVNYVATVPGRRGPLLACVVEAVISFLMMTAILHASNREALAPYTGLIAGLLVALFITLAGPYSGMSMNPARTAASALFARRWRPTWLYFAAPIAGMLLAAAAFLRTPGPGHAYCAKLCHLGGEPCPFLCEFGHLHHTSNDELAGGDHNPLR